MRVKKELVCLSANLLLLTAGLFGTLYSLISAFELPVQNGILACFCLLFAAAGALIFTFCSPRRWYLLLGGCVLVFGYALWSNWLKVTRGVQEIAALIVEQYSLAFEGVYPIEAAEGLSAAERASACTAVLVLAAFLLACWFSWVLIQHRLFWLAILPTIPFLSVSLILTKAPAWPALWTLLLFYGLLLLCRMAGKRDAYGGAKLTLISLPFLLALLLGIHALSPEEEYEYADWAGEVAVRLTDMAAQTGIQFRTIPGTGSTMEPLGEVNLSQAGPLRFTGETVLKVQAYASGSMYLRGFSSGIYNGRDWEMLPQESYDRYRKEVAGLPVDYPPPPLNFAAYAALTDYYTELTTVQIQNLAADRRYYYTPYQFFAPGSDVPLSIGQDSYLGLTDEITEYRIDSLLTANPIEGGILMGEAAMVEKTYRDFAYREYLQLPDGMKEQLLNLLRDSKDAEELLELGEMGALDSVSRMRLVELVAQFLGEQAKYEPETPVTPLYQDFVLYFLQSGRQGYCVHFASAGTVLLRALGIPARFVTGYVTELTPGKMVSVPDYAAHAWVEVYFDGYGWQPVEMTPGYDGDFPWQPEEEPTEPEGGPLPGEEDPGEIPSENPPPEEPAPEEQPQPEPPQPEIIDDSSYTVGKVGGGPANGETPPESGDSIDWRKYRLPIALLAVVLFLILRRHWMLARRKRQFNDPNPNRAAVAAYAYLVRLLPNLESDFSEEIRKLAEKAKFSQHALTEEERSKVVGYVTHKVKGLDGAVSLPVRLYLRSIRALC